MAKRPAYILPVIIYSQFAGTSLWFAGNAVLPSLIAERNLGEHVLADITTSVQAGFILGTLAFAITSIADRWSPSKIFLIASLVGAIFNTMLYHWSGGISGILIIRFLTGVTLAGIYPVGMKIAADWYEQGLGKALGYLVGALVLGTAFPHFLSSLGASLDWGVTLYLVSLLCASGGILVYLLIKDGPNRKKLSHFKANALFELFRYQDFRASVLGYFGHMWELYTFWAFIPVLLLEYQANSDYNLNISLWAFIIISMGALGCIVGGLISVKRGNGIVAFVNLFISGLCILLFPIMIKMPVVIFLAYMIIWGWTVVGDSPQFSSMSAKTASKELVGSGLTIMNSIGFALTILSIYTFKLLHNLHGLEWAVGVLIIGPVIGLLSIIGLVKKRM